MDNVLGRQLWDIYENLKREKKIGFLTDYEFQKYFLGFISYKYISEKLEVYINNELKEENSNFQEAFKYDDNKISLREKSINDIGYFLRPNLLFKNVVSSNYGSNGIIEEVEYAFKEISDSSVGTESEEDFENLFEGVDLRASQLGKTFNDKNRVVFNILDAISQVNFDLDNENSDNTLLKRSILENRKLNKNSKGNIRSKLRNRKAHRNRLNANKKLSLEGDSNSLKNNISGDMFKEKASANMSLMNKSIIAEEALMNKSISADRALMKEANYAIEDNHIKMNANEVAIEEDAFLKMNANEIEEDAYLVNDDGFIELDELVLFDDSDDFLEDPDNRIGGSFEYLLSKFSLNSSNSIDYYTPNDVSKLIASLIASQKDQLDSVYDPCCGSASLLLEINKNVHCKFICGQELNTSIYNIARENMILHNIHYKDFDIKQGDTLEEPQHLGWTFDAVVCEMPFNARWTAEKRFLDDPRFSEYNILAPRPKADYAFIQHMLYHLDDDGIMIVVAPHGVLFRSAAEGTIRKFIVDKKNYLDAVIGLPANMFYSTNIPTCIMIFKKNRNPNDDVLFIDASNDFNRVKLINNLREEDIEKIVLSYHFRDEIERYSHRASLEEIAKNDFNLNIPRYVDSYEPSEKIDAEELMKDHRETVYELEEVTQEIKKMYNELNIEDLIFD